MKELEAKLKFWLKNNLNVLLIGKHGVGKTSQTKKIFEEEGLLPIDTSNGISSLGKKYIYFSAPTMDVWTDLIGIPEKKQEDNKYYLDYLRPKYLDDLEAIFIDELNRPASKKLLDAVMQLIQFKSINGYKFPKLRVVWAAINPSDDPLEQYQVINLDQAHKDRFHIHYEVPYLPDTQYFIEKFGEQQAQAAISWWSDLSDIEKNKISPRRLDDALKIYNLGGSIRDVLPANVNISKLLLQIKTQPIHLTINELYESQDSEKSTQFLLNENNFNSSIKEILQNKNHLNFFLPLLNQEKKLSLMNDSRLVRKIIFENPYLFLEEIVIFVNKNNKNSWSKKIKNILLSKIHFNMNSSWNELVQLIDSDFMKIKPTSIMDRKRKYSFLKDAIPINIPLPIHDSNFYKLENILIQELFMPSHDKTLKEEMPLIVPMIRHVLNSSLKKNWFTKAPIKDGDFILAQVEDISKTIDDLNARYGENFYKKIIKYN